MLARDFIHLNQRNLFYIPKDLIPLRGSAIPFLLRRDLNEQGITNINIMEWFNDKQYNCEDKEKSFLHFFQINTSFLRYPYWDVEKTMKMLNKDFTIHKDSIYEHKLFFNYLYGKYMILMNYLCDSYEKNGEVVIINGRFKLSERILIEAFAETCNLITNENAYKIANGIHFKKKGKTLCLFESFLGTVLYLNKFYYQELSIGEFVDYLMMKDFKVL